MKNKKEKFATDCGGIKVHKLNELKRPQQNTKQNKKSKKK